MPDTAWKKHAIDTLEQTGHLRGAARLAVIQVLAQQDCLTTREDVQLERLRGSCPTCRHAE
jgi:Zn finger protein HypA/HybF involved in hydrogenase expression